MEKKTLKMIRGSKERPQGVRNMLSEWGGLTYFTDLEWLSGEHTLFFVNDRKVVVGIPDNDSILECLNYKEETLPPLPEKKADEEIQLPETWEEFCITHNIREEKEYFINNASKILSICDGVRSPQLDKNMLPNQDTAEAILALCQLIQLRDCYNEGWQPNWEDGKEKFEIKIDFNKSFCTTGYSYATVLYFKTQELRDDFFNNFKDLIERIKPLYGIMEGGEK